MLKFTQKAGKTIRIDNEIKITVLETIGKQVTLGIEAPSRVQIYRTELYLQYAKKNGNKQKNSEMTVTNVSLDREKPSSMVKQVREAGDV